MYLDQHFLGGQGEPRREDLRPEGQGQRGRDEGIRGRNASRFAPLAGPGGWITLLKTSEKHSKPWKTMEDLSFFGRVDLCRICL